MIDTMGGVNMNEQRSLERLKALDSLPDLHSQLAEVNRLCNHPARAEMIAKWLLDKLKKSEDTRSKPETWQSLASTIRLLSPERLGLLLASNNFIETLLTALEETSNPDLLFDSIASLVDYLVEVSAGPSGTPIKALLSLASPQAARLLGLWLQNAVHKPLSLDIALKRNLTSTLQTGIAIWQLRKNAAEENRDFASRCLVPAALLLTTCSSLGQEDRSSKKRPAGNDDSLKDDIAKQLEILLARHVFLPSRTTFYKSQDVVNIKAQKQAESQKFTFAIESLLKPLKSGILEHQSHLKALPLLLDIALRCVAIPTQRQRTKEKPWIEALFQTLHDCNRHKSIDRADLTTLVKMLQVIASRATLSPETLKMLIWEHSILSISHDVEEWWKTCSAEHWTIIVQVLEMNADIFTDPTLAEAVFVWLSKSVRRNITEHANEVSEAADAPSLDAEIIRWRTRWLGEILVPIMKAFGRRRNLPTFIDLWSQQLEQEPSEHVWSAWVELDSYLHLELEDSMTDEQILELFDRLSQSITSASAGGSTETTSPRISKIESSIVMLNGMLGEFRSEKLAETIATKCESLLNCLLKLFDIPEDTSNLFSSVINARRIWLLLTKTVELWLAFWLDKQRGADSTTEKLAEILGHKAVKAALAVSRTRYCNDKITPAAATEADDAQCFVGSICHHIAPYEQSLAPAMQDVLAETLSDLLQHLETHRPQVLCVYNDLLLRAREPEHRSHFLLKCISIAAAWEDKPSAAAASLKTLQAATAAAVRYRQAVVLEDIVHIVTDWIGPLRRPRNSFTVDLLLQIPVTSLARSQREQILNTLTGDRSHPNELRGEGVRSRLALMIKMMEVPNASCELSTDHDVMWRIILGFHNASSYARYGEDALTEASDAKTLGLVEELARLLVRHLLGTQDQERSRSVLIELSKDCKAVLESYCGQSNMFQKLLGLILSRTVVQELETGAKDSLKLQLPHRSAQTAESLLDRLSETVKDTLMLINGSNANGLWSHQATSLYVILDALTVVLRLALSISSDNTNDLVIQAVERIMTPPLGLREPGNAILSPALKSALVRCFMIGCKYGPMDASLAQARFGLHLLDMELQPAELKLVIDAFAAFVERLDSGERFPLIQHIFGSLDTMPLSSLLLLQTCLSNLEREDTSIGDCPLQHHILPQLLNIATESNNAAKQERAMSCIMTVLKQKPFLNSQHTVDLTLAKAPILLLRPPSDSRNFLDVCRIASALLLNHRARLQGRFHLVNKVFQSLMSKLFTPHKQSASSTTQSKPLGPEHAHALSRSLTLFCEPLQLRRQANAASLTDESRKEQAHVGRFVQNVLHHYCGQVLNGSLADGVSDALKPGLRSMIEAIEMNDADGVRHLSASMSNSERAVLRSVYDDWRRFGKWRGA